MGMDVFGIADPSCYFRASVWSWRPLAYLIEEANIRFAVGISEETLELMHYNQGAGVRSQSQCYALADALERILAETTHHAFTLDSDGMGVEGVIEAALSASGWTFNGGCPYRIDREHVEEFIRFLRVCGGFEVW
jgi:hypothetical protein